jgi:hypothetical protein
MNEIIGLWAFSTLLAVMLVSVGVVPVVACEPGTPCGDAIEDLQKAAEKQANVESLAYIDSISEEK